MFAANSLKASLKFVAIAKSNCRRERRND